MLTNQTFKYLLKSSISVFLLLYTWVIQCYMLKNSLILSVQTRNSSWGVTRFTSSDDADSVTWLFFSLCLIIMSAQLSEIISCYWVLKWLCTRSSLLSEWWLFIWSDMNRLAELKDVILWICWLIIYRVVNHCFC